MSLDLAASSARSLPAPPFTGETGHEIFAKAIAADTSEAIERLNQSHAPIDLLTLAKWCLAPIPGDRPTDGSEIVEVLHAYFRSDQNRAEQDMFRFFELSLDFFCIASSEGYFLRFNDTFSRLLGYSEDELKSRPFVEFVHPDDRERTDGECARLSQGAPTVRFVNRYRDIHGSYHWIEWNALAVMEERLIYAVARVVREEARRDYPE